MCRLLVRTSVTRWRLLSSSHVARLYIAASSCKLVYNGDCSCACASLCACGWVCLWKPALSDNESNLRSWMDLACLWCKAFLPSETSIQLLKHIRRWANVRDMLSLQQPALSDNESNLRSWMNLACLWCKAFLPSETFIQLLKHIRRWANVSDMLSVQHLPYYWLICSSHTILFKKKIFIFFYRFFFFK